MNQRSRLGFPMLVLALSVLSAYLCAAIWAAVQRLSLPGSDSARGQTVGQTFSDPFVVMIGGTVASIVGLAVFPIALICLRRRDPVRCGVFVVSVTILFIILATALEPRLGLVGSPVVALGALFFCRFTRLEFFQAHGGLGDVA